MNIPAIELPMDKIAEFGDRRQIVEFILFGGERAIASPSLPMLESSY